MHSNEKTFSNHIYPKDWDCHSLGELAVHVGSGATPRGGSEIYQEEGVLFIRSQNVTFEGLLLDNAAHIDESTHLSMSRSEIFPHDVLLNITGASIGRCCTMPEGLGKANVNQHVCAIRLPNPTKHDAAFLAYVLSSPIGQSQIDQLNAGGNREGLNYQQLRSFTVPWPQRLERKRITHILDTADSAIQQTEQLIAKLKQVKAGLLHDLLTRGLDAHGNLRNPDAHPEQFKMVPFSELAWVNPSTSIPNPPSTEPVSFIPMADVSEGGFWANKQSRRLEEVSRGYTSFQDDDVLFAKITPCTENGKGCIVNNLVNGIGFGSTEFHILRARSEVSPRFIYYWSIAPEFRKKAEAMMTGSAGQRRVPKEFFDKFLVAYFPIDVQVKVTEILDAHNGRIRAEEAYRDKLQAIKQGLMHDLLTGKVRV